MDDRQDYSNRGYSKSSDDEIAEAVVFYQKETKKQLQESHRKRKDWVEWMSTTMTIVAWVTMFAVWIIVQAAAPEVEWAFLAGFGRIVFGMEPVLRGSWDYALVYLAFILLLIAIVMSVIAFALHLMQKRKKADKIKISILITSAISVVILVVFLINFGYKLL